MRTIKILIVTLVLAAVASAQIGAGGNVGTYSTPTTKRLYWDASGNLQYACEALGIQPASSFTVSGATLTSITDSTNTGTVVLPSHGFIAKQQITVAGVTRTIADVAPSIVVLTDVATATSVAHGLGVGTPFVLSGATVDTDLNGSYVVASVPTDDTFTFSTSSVADATYVETTIEFAIGDADLAGTYLVATVSDANTFTITTANVTDAVYNFTGLTATSTAPRTSASIWSATLFQYDVSNNLTSQSAPVPAVACDDRASLGYK